MKCPSSSITLLCFIFFLFYYRTSLYFIISSSFLSLLTSFSVCPISFLSLYFLSPPTYSFPSSSSLMLLPLLYLLFLPSSFIHIPFLLRLLLFPLFPFLLLFPISIFHVLFLLTFSPPAFPSLHYFSPLSHSPFSPSSPFYLCLLHP